MTPELKDAVEKELLKLLSIVDPKLIVKMDERTGTLLIGDDRPDPARLANLKAEAEFLLRSDLWKLLYETPKALAERTMFVSGESLDDLKKGRAMLFTLATQKKIIDTFLKVIPRGK